MRRERWLALAALLLAAAPALPQKPLTPQKEEQIQDNSFLLEEAYNQEEGVVQHINAFTRDFRSGEWAYTFTQEWPLGGQKHQLSYTVPLLSLEDGGFVRQLGDVALNYRYQLIGSGEARLAMAPRFTLLLPTGDWEKGYGNGTTGYQLGVPISVVLAERLVGHANAILTFVPRRRGPDGSKANGLDVGLGASVIWLAKARLNAMLEALWVRSEDVVATGRSEGTKTFFVGAGIRWSYSFASGLQIVPGAAFLVGAGPSAGETGLFLYLSFEHPIAMLAR